MGSHMRILCSGDAYVGGGETSVREHPHGSSYNF
jgi:hypothetical protein